MINSYKFRYKIRDNKVAIVKQPDSSRYRRVLFVIDGWTIKSISCPEISISNRKIFLRGDDDRKDEDWLEIRSDEIPKIFKKIQIKFEEEY